MKAIAIDEFGSLDRLEYREMPDLEAGEGEVVIQTTYAALNNMDLQMLTDGTRYGQTKRGQIDSLGPSFPYVPGEEGVGRIAEVGPGVEGWQVGDRVAPHIVLTCGECEMCRAGKEAICRNIGLLGITTGGSYAEQIRCSARRLVRIPDMLSDEEAAAVQVGFATSWQGLVNRAGLRPGETVLVNAVGSGVGSAAVQIAKLVGASLVIGTASSDEKLERAKEMGLDVGIKYTEEDLVAGVHAATDGLGVDVVYESVGGDTFVKSVEAMARDGRLVTVGGHASQKIGGAENGADGLVPFDVVAYFRSRKNVMGSSVYPRSVVEEVMAMAGEGRLEPVVHRVYPLQEARAALEEMGRREIFGKVLLKVSD